jgi:hypothetical protein
MMTMGQSVGSCPSANGPDGKLWASTGLGESPLTWAFAMERVTGIEPALSAWELACHALPTTVFAGQGLFALPVDDRHRPSETIASGT